MGMPRKFRYLPRTHVGWCWYCVPLYTDACAPNFSGWESALLRPKLVDAQWDDFPINHIFDPIRIAKILEPANCSKVFFPTLKKSFFADTKWEFASKGKFYNVVENSFRRLQRTE